MAQFVNVHVPFNAKIFISRVYCVFLVSVLKTKIVRWDINHRKKEEEVCTEYALRILRIFFACWKMRRICEECEVGEEYAKKIRRKYEEFLGFLKMRRIRRISSHDMYA